MEVVFAVVALLAMANELYMRSEGVRFRHMSGGDFSEEELARIMPDEYRQYRPMFEAQASMRLHLDIRHL